MRKFTHIHSSSRYDRSPESAAKAAKSYFEVAELVTWTEIEWNIRAQAIRNVGRPDYGFVNGDNSNQNDCGISFSKERFELLYFENYKAGRVPFYLGNTKKLDVQYMTIAVLRDKTNKKKLAVGVIHLASGVEGDMAAKRTTRNTLNWYASFRASKAGLNKVAKRFKCNGTMYVADFNVDFKRSWFRGLLKTLAPFYMSTWKNVNTGGGTHGGRIIDGTLLKGKIGVRRSAVLHKDDDSSDHRPYRETLVWLN